MTTTTTSRRRKSIPVDPKSATAELLIQQHEANAAAARAAYAENDRILAELREILGIEKPIVLTDGRRARIKDNFRDSAGNPKIVAYKPCGIRLYDLDVR